MNWFAAALALFALVHGAHCATTATEWCYHSSNCDDSQWPTIAPNYCNGSRQSPIDIVTASAQIDKDLTPFIFTNYDSKTALDKIMNTGKTVKATLKGGLKVEGGDLGVPYDSLQFHLHWGNGVSKKGSEHTVDGKRYAMEFHIVNVKSSYNGNTTLAIADSKGLAALGFLIEKGIPDATSGAAWDKFTSYLGNIAEKGQSVSPAAGISMNDLLSGVDRTKYYRYLGSLTTPNCNEAVVWTVFKEPIKVSEDNINRFSNTVRIGNSTSAFMVDVFRNIQPNQPVTYSSSSTTCYSLGLMALSLILGRS